MSEPALTSIRGQHRNRALASARRTRALELVREGKNYQQIADEIGIAHRGTVHRMVTSTLSEREADEVEFHRLTEYARLERLYQALMPAVKKGDVKAVNEARRIINAEMRLLGLLRPARPHQAESVMPTTVVMQPETVASEASPESNRMLPF